MNVLYLCDANVLIDANQDYYPIERVPEFWDWLVAMGESGQVKVPEEIVLPRSSRPDALVDWLVIHRDKMVLDEEVDRELLDRVIEEGYADDLTDQEFATMGRDPFLIAYALDNPPNRCVVTTERSRPSRKRANRHVPDICQDLDVRSLNTFDLIRELDFCTSRRKQH